MSPQLLVIVGILAVALVTLIAVLLVRRGHVRRQLDRMIPPEPLSADEVAYRIGVGDPVRRPTEPLVQLAPVVLTRAAPALAVEPPSPFRSASARERLIRDTGAALAGLAAIVLLAVAVWPPTPNGGVLSATATPGETAVVAVLVPETPPAEAAVVPPVPNETPVDPVVTPPTAVPAETPRPQGTATVGTTFVATPRAPVTPRLHAKPRVTPTPTPTPRPIFGPTPRPTPAPTPTPTPTPTPAPNSLPAPTPTPTPPRRPRRPRRRRRRRRRPRPRRRHPDPDADAHADPRPRRPPRPRHRSRRRPRPLSRPRCQSTRQSTRRSAPSRFPNRTNALRRGPRREVSCYTPGALSGEP